MGIELPKSIIKAERKNPKRLVLYGPPKVGKTTFLSQLKDNLIVDLESGSDYVDALKIKANNFDELNEVGKKIHEANKPYKFISIDTCTELESWCEWDATEKYMKTPIGKNFNLGLPRSQWESVLTLPQGAGYLYLRLSFIKWIDKLSTLADHIILIAHLKDKMIEKKGKEVSSKDLDLTGKLRSIVSANCDAIGYMYRNAENELRVNFSSSDEVLCGARSEHLKGADVPADWSKIFIK